MWAFVVSFLRRLFRRPAPPAALPPPSAFDKARADQRAYYEALGNPLHWEWRVLSGELHLLLFRGAQVVFFVPPGEAHTLKAEAERLCAASGIPLESLPTVPPEPEGLGGFT